MTDARGMKEAPGKRKGIRDGEEKVAEGGEKKLQGEGDFFELFKYFYIKILF